MRTGATSRGGSRADRIAGRLATTGLGLIIGCLASGAFLYHHLRTCRTGPLEWRDIGPLGLSMTRWEVLGAWLPLGAALAGLVLPLGRIRSALSRVLWGVVFGLLGLLCLMALHLVVAFLFYCALMACPG